jgi:NAD(P)H-nitrite reductase large subunit
MSKKIVIIGNGISGVTAAREIRKKSNASITIISEESKFFFSRTALMYVYMGHMRFRDIQPYEDDFWQQNNLEILEDKVLFVNPEENQIELSKGGKLNYDELIIASGSKSNVFNWPGTQYEGVQGLYFKQDLENLEKRSPKIKKAAIIGGGLIGIELAEMLLTRGVEVYFLVREALFWNGVLPNADAEFVGNHLTKHHGLHMLYETELDEIIGDDTNGVSGIKTKDGKHLDVELVGLTVGVSPNIDFLKSSSIELERGISVNEFLQTNHKNIYAIGDCAQFKQAIGKRRPIEQVWYTGRMMGETVANSIIGNPTAYTPGNWFNSAKFFDLEYQTYGWVFSKREENEAELIWYDPKKERMLHFVFEKETHELIGINTFGIRLRHEIFDAFLNEKRDMKYVLQNLKMANFDPEFFKPFEQAIVNQYNTQFKQNVTLAKKVWWQKLVNHGE